MANIFDILLDAKRAVRNNIYLSWGYISYQVRNYSAAFPQKYDVITLFSLD